MEEEQDTTATGTEAHCEPVQLTGRYPQERASVMPSGQRPSSQAVLQSFVLSTHARTYRTYVACWQTNDTSRVGLQDTLRLSQEAMPKPPAQ